MNSNHDEYASGDVTAPKARIQRALVSCALFKAASPTTLESAANVAVLDEVSSGKPLVIQGSTAHVIVVVARGRARVERMLPTGNAMPIGYRGVSDFVGETCLIGAETYEENVVAMSDCEVVRIPVQSALILLKNDPTLAPALASVLLQRQAEVEERLTSLLFRPVEGRVAEFLLQAAERWGVAEPRGTMISAPITHLEIARVIGSTRETVTVTLGALRRDGLLATAGRRIIIVDREGLAKRK